MNDLAATLTGEFGKGYSLTNLKMMRKFYLTYLSMIGPTASDFLPQSQKGQTVSDQLLKSATRSRKSGAVEISQTPSGKFTLGWSHYIFLLGIKDNGERSFYEIEAAQLGWSLRELKRQFNSGLYERLALNRDKDGIRKLAAEAPTVDIVLCKKKHDALVEITLPSDANIHAKEYQLYLPDKELLRRKLTEWGEEVGG